MNNYILKILLLSALFIQSIFLLGQETKTDLSVYPDTIFFRINKYVIDSTEIKKMEMVANYMEKLPHVSVEVIGYSGMNRNKKGASRISLRLSQARAEQVAKILHLKYNIDKDRIKAIDGDRVNAQDSVRQSISGRYVIFKIKTERN
ncbi:hypothetical protein M2451_001758 [Dysgonomonas sp. PFB1-18]|uniref:OmpA family protein n=1 Tax=unclassified Dysgonomonas TaxID=2630389 RepID=UPI0024757034|nr:MULTISPECIES: OmpA family protein [unclassified Dysgonomonas]MDH6309187.1 hypothetical protein [Dysgonomonas sp. PF1-14]MDH6338933.1 hypothetical protein [Dysgonomonas sp. PF1-16]MDH6380436.1 hypothetical protein [Dysgonomonas sp. PFB1-18]MDH6397761.1 hypothetical protein [Dysgonomonas sp. PF1-23]